MPPPPKRTGGLAPVGETMHPPLKRRGPTAVGEMMPPPPKRASVSTLVGAMMPPPSKRVSRSAPVSEVMQPPPARGGSAPVGTNQTVEIEMPTTDEMPPQPSSSFTEMQKQQQEMAELEAASVAIQAGIDSLKARQQKSKALSDEDQKELQELQAAALTLEAGLAAMKSTKTSAKTSETLLAIGTSEVASYCVFTRCLCPYVCAQVDTHPKPQLPPDWQAVPSKSRPGAVSYFHIPTGWAQRNFPDASLTSQQIMAHMRKRKTVVTKPPTSSTQEGSSQKQSLFFLDKVETACAASQPALQQDEEGDSWCSWGI